MDIKSIVVTATGFDVTASDDSVKSFVDSSTVTTTPAPVAPEATEVDLMMTDGSTKTFVPKV